MYWETTWWEANNQRIGALWQGGTRHGDYQRCVCSATGGPGGPLVSVTDGPGRPLVGGTVHSMTGPLTQIAWTTYFFQPLRYNNMYHLSKGTWNVAILALMSEKFHQKQFPLLSRFPWLAGSKDTSPEWKQWSCPWLRSRIRRRATTPTMCVAQRRIKGNKNLHI